MSTFDGEAAVRLQSLMLSELMAIKWAVTLPGMPLSALEDLTDVTIQTENYELQSRIFSEISRRLEEGEASAQQGTALRLMKHKLEREDNLGFQEQSPEILR
jgi:hypothetical protein